jgi:hypothetical protein
MLKKTSVGPLYLTMNDAVAKFTVHAGTMEVRLAIAVV